MTIKVISTEAKTVSPAQEEKVAPQVEESEADKQAKLAKDQAETLPESDAEETKDEDETQAKDGEEEEDGDEDAKPKKPLKGFKKRIDKLNRRNAELEAELNRLRANQKPQEVEKPKVTGRPKADDFETHDAFVEALADWKTEQKLSERDAKQKNESERTTFEAKLSDYQKRVQKLVKEQEGASEVFEAVDDIFIPRYIADIFLESESGHELSYQLAKDPDEFERICSLPERQALLAIGEFKASLKSAENKSTDKKTTKAPEPIRPVQGRATQSTRKSIYDPNLSQAEYEALRKQQIARRA